MSKLERTFSGRSRRWELPRRRTGQFLTTLLAWPAALPALAGPGGLTVQQGQVNAVQNGNRLDISASHNAVLNWQSFNIGAGESVNFHQPSATSVVWNRIFDSSPSQILGSLHADGIVVLMNQNGFFFGPNSSIIVGGFVATTVPIAPSSPVGSGLWQYSGPPPLASIINYGEVRARSGGSVFMVAEKIENHGVLSAPDGTLGLYAGKEVLLSERPDGRGLSAHVALPEGSIDNDGKLIADAGSIALHARVVNNQGTVQANSVRDHNGVIEFVATEKVELGASSLVQARGDSAAPSDGGTVRIQSAQTFIDHAGSKIDVSGGAQGGNGGSLELSAHAIGSLQSFLDGRAIKGWRSGTLLFDPEDIILTGADDAGSDPSTGAHVGDAPGSTLRLNVNTAFANFSQIHLEANHDITFEPATVWDLNASTGISDPGSKLTLEAGNNIVFGDNARIVAGAGWGVSLSAGVNFALPSHEVARGVGSIYFDGGAADSTGSKPTGAGAVESFDGEIQLAAGHEIIVGGGYIRSTGGGNIHIQTGDGNVDSGTKNDGYEFSRRGYQVSSRGLGGIGTANGGDLSINAGGDILAFTAPIGAFGAGAVDLTAGRDIKGQFMLRDGVGTLHAGSDVGSPSSPVSLGLVSGGWKVTAAQNLYLNEVYNPNGSLNGNRVIFGTRIPFQFDYAPDAYVELNAGNGVQLLGLNPATTVGNQDRPIIYPGRLDITAGAGGITLGNDVILAPTPLGGFNLHTTAGGSLQSANGGFYQLVMSDSGSANYHDFGSGHAAGTPLHLNGGDAGARLDIAGDVQNVFLRIARQADLSIGGNAINFSFEGQNLSPNDVTTLHVGGNIVNRIDRTFVSSSSAPDFGVFDPLISINPDLGSRLTYNRTTHQLAFQGIMTAAERDFLIHPLTYDLDPVTRDIRRDAQGNPILIPAVFSPDAGAIQNLYTQSQDIPTSPLARNGLQLGGPGKFDISAQNMDLGITAGIRSVGVQLNRTLAGISYLGADVKLSLGGDLDMASSQLASFSGGSIDVSTGGKLNVGSQEQFTSDDTPKGIYTAHGGHVSVESDGDINVNGSRIATYDGGDISVVSKHGNIDAGAGGKGFFTVTTTDFDPATGLPVDRSDEFFGSGIVALTRRDSNVKVGDIDVNAGRDIVDSPGKGGDIIANTGGVLQLAFNHADQSKAVVRLRANGDIKANQSGILGRTVDLDAKGNIDGLVVSVGDTTIHATGNANVSVLAGGVAGVSGQSVSGSIIGGSGTAVSGGTVTATVTSLGGSGGGNAFQSVAAPAAQQTTTESEKKATTAATTATDTDEEQKKRAAAQKPVLAKTSGRVTIIFPKH